MVPFRQKVESTIPALRRYARALTRNADLADDLATLVIDPPDRTFDDSATIEVGGRRVELRHLGRGHTDADIVVSVPDADVLFAGDLLENDAVPYFGDGYPIEWPATVARLLAMVSGPVVPGHGSIGDRTFVERQLGDRLVDVGNRDPDVVGGHETELTLARVVERARSGRVRALHACERRGRDRPHGDGAPREKRPPRHPRVGAVDLVTHRSAFLEVPGRADPLMPPQGCRHPEPRAQAG